MNLKLTLVQRLGQRPSAQGQPALQQACLSIISQALVSLCKANTRLLANYLLQFLECYWCLQLVSALQCVLHSLAVQ